MKCPSLKEIPKPPAGKIGWPWTEETPILSAPAPGGAPWPRISIVTPSFNQGQFIETAIRSVLLQGYPDIEYLIMDGGSTDASVEIIKKYEPWLAAAVSEKDRGQSHAINKGIERVTGYIFNWLNSDDSFKPGAFEVVARAAITDPEAVAWAGKCARVDTKGKIIEIGAPGGLTRDELVDNKNTYINQPACFSKMEAVREAGPIDESLHFAMDTDLWIRLATIGRISRVDFILAEAVVHDNMKSRYLFNEGLAEHAILQCRYGYEHLAKKYISDLAASDLSYRKRLARITSSPIYRILRPLLKIFGLVEDK